MGSTPASTPHHDGDLSSPGAQTRTLLAFFTLTFALSWSLWLIDVATQGFLRWPLPSPMTQLLGAFGPTLAAVLVTVASAGLSGLRALFRRLLIWRVSILWYLFALLWPIVHSLATTTVSVATGSAAPNFGDPPVFEVYPIPAEAPGAGPWVLLPFVFLQNLLLGSALGEEVGWRGFALPRLQACWSAVWAGVLLGAVWGAWHVPRLLREVTVLGVADFSAFMLGIIGESLLYTWLFNNTRGSLLPVLLLHAATATAGLFLVQAESHLLIRPVLTWLVALPVVLCTNPRTLQRRGVRQTGGVPSTPIYPPRGRQ